MKTLFSFFIMLLCAVSLFANGEEEIDCITCENQKLQNREMSYSRQITGVFTESTPRYNYNWPFKPFGEACPLGHVSHSFQYYSGEPYFHHGIDIRMPASTNIFSSTGGKVVNIENYISGNDLYWEIAILDDEGFLWQYHHVDYSSIPREIFDAYETGQSIPSQTHIGNVVFWPVKAYGENFHHIHVNVLDSNKNFLNPLLFLIPPKDSTPPVIETIYFTEDEGNNVVNKNSLSGNIDIIVKAEDKMDNEPYQLTIYKIEYEIQSLDKKHKVPKTKLWQFDRLPGGGDINKDVYTVYKKSLYVNGQYLSTSGNYYSRNFYIIATNQQNGKVSKNGHWDTTSLPNGTYEVIVHVTDFNGNSTNKSIQVQIQN